MLLYKMLFIAWHNVILFDSSCLSYLSSNFNSVFLHFYRAVPRISVFTRHNFKIINFLLRVKIMYIPKKRKRLEKFHRTSGLQCFIGSCARVSVTTSLPRAVTLCGRRSSRPRESDIAKNRKRPWSQTPAYMQTLHSTGQTRPRRRDCFVETALYGLRENAHARVGNQRGFMVGGE